MANRYWIGGSGNWNDTAHWSTTSGGSGGADVPTNVDDVFFDENSTDANDTVVTLNANHILKSLDLSGIIYTIQFVPSASAKGLDIRGNCTLSPLSSFDFTTYYGHIYLQPETGGTYTFTTANVPLVNVYIYVGWYNAPASDYTWILNGNINNRSTDPDNQYGEVDFDCNITFTDQHIETDDFEVYGPSTIVNLGSAVITSRQYVYIDSDTILNADESIINLVCESNGYNCTLDLDGASLNIVNISTLAPAGFSGYTIMEGTGLIKRLTINPNTIIKWDNDSSWTVETLTASSSSFDVRYLDSGSIVSWSIFNAGGGYTVNDVLTFQDGSNGQLRVDSVNSEELGSELITNGSFTGNANGWNLFGSTYNNDAVDFVFPGGTGAYSAFQQPGGIASLTWYKVEFDVSNSNNGAATLKAVVGGASVATTNTDGHKIVYVKSPTTPNTAMGITLGQTGAGSLTIDNVSVKQVSVREGSIASATLINSGTNYSVQTDFLTGGTGTDAKYTINEIRQSKFSIIKRTGYVQLSNMSIANSTATGGAIWYAGSTSIDGGGNSGWLFEDYPPPPNFVPESPGGRTRRGTYFKRKLPTVQSKKNEIKRLKFEYLKELL